MLHSVRMMLFPANDHPGRRRQRRCIPLLPGLAACLEDRVLLSAAGGRAHAAEMATNPADTKVGKEVVRLFESILQTNPTTAQVTQFVHKMHSGMTVSAMRKDLIAEARIQPNTGATNVVIMNGGSSAPSATASAGSTITAAMFSARSGMPQSMLTSSVSQVPAGMSLSLTLTSATTSTSTAASPAGTSTSTTSSPTSTASSPTSTPTPSPTPAPMSPTPAPMSPTSTMGAPTSIDW
jgi:hypothetical protein